MRHCDILPERSCDRKIATPGPPNGTKTTVPAFEFDEPTPGVRFFRSPSDADPHIAEPNKHKAIGKIPLIQPRQKVRHQIIPQSISFVHRGIKLSRHRTKIQSQRTEATHKQRYPYSTHANSSPAPTPGVKVRETGSILTLQTGKFCPHRAKPPHYGFTVLAIPFPGQIGNFSPVPWSCSCPSR